MYGIQFSELEIKILNGFYHDVDVSFIEFLLLTDLIQYEEPNKVIGDLQTQGYSYIEGIDIYVLEIIMKLISIFRRIYIMTEVKYLKSMCTIVLCMKLLCVCRENF